jgi:hypothetical protein
VNATPYRIPAEKPPKPRYRLSRQGKNMLAGCCSGPSGCALIQALMIGVDDRMTLHIFVLGGLLICILSLALAIVHHNLELVREPECLQPPNGIQRWVKPR